MKVEGIFFPFCLIQDSNNFFRRTPKKNFIIEEFINFKMQPWCEICCVIQRRNPKTGICTYWFLGIYTPKIWLIHLQPTVKTQKPFAMWNNFKEKEDFPPFTIFDATCNTKRTFLPKGHVLNLKKNQDLKEYCLLQLINSPLSWIKDTFYISFHCWNVIQS